MKKYSIDDLVRKAPHGTTHINYSEFCYSYISHDSEGFRVWLGISHGGWSEKMKHRHPNYSSLIEILI